MSIPCHKEPVRVSTTAHMFAVIYQKKNFQQNLVVKYPNKNSTNLLFLLITGSVDPKVSPKLIPQIITFSTAGRCSNHLKFLSRFQLPTLISSYQNLASILKCT